MDISLMGWDIGHFDDVEWAAWGSGGNARAKVIAAGDGFYLAFVEADAGYKGDPHEHAATEFAYVVEGTIRTQGVEMKVGDAYVATIGSMHNDFETEAGAKYVSIFKL